MKVFLKEIQYDSLAPKHSGDKKDLGPQVRRLAAQAKI
jgi:hypothetical protein